VGGLDWVGVVIVDVVVVIVVVIVVVMLMGALYLVESSRLHRLFQEA
jgi:hypothetical protein